VRNQLIGLFLEEHLRRDGSVWTAPIRFEFVRRNPKRRVCCARTDRQRTLSGSMRWLFAILTDRRRIGRYGRVLTPQPRLESPPRCVGMSRMSTSARYTITAHTPMMAGQSRLRFDIRKSRSRLLAALVGAVRSVAKACTTMPSVADDGAAHSADEALPGAAVLIREPLAGGAKAVGRGQRSTRVRLRSSFSMSTRP
jgi:hypothetical protein